MLLELYLISCAITFVYVTGVYFYHFQKTFPTLAKERRFTDVVDSYLFGLLCTPLSFLGVLTVCILARSKLGWRWPTMKPWMENE